MIEFTINRPLKMLRIISPEFDNDFGQKEDRLKQFFQSLSPALKSGELVLEEFRLGCSQTLSRLLTNGRYDFIYFPNTIKNETGKLGIKLYLDKDQKTFLPINEVAGLLPKDRPPFLVSVEVSVDKEFKEIEDIFSEKGVFRTVAFSGSSDNPGGTKMVSEFFKELVSRMQEGPNQTAVEEALGFVGLDTGSIPRVFLTSKSASDEKMVFKEDTGELRTLINIKQSAEPSAAPVGSQSFIGRWDSMAQAESAIEEGIRVLEVNGSAGAGKTFFAHELGSKMLRTLEESLAVEKIFFIEGRLDGGSLYGDLIDRLEKLFFRFSEEALSRIVGNQIDYPDPKNKAKALAKALGERSFLFVFDNFESYLDDDRKIRDATLQDFFSELVASVDSRVRFVLISQHQLELTKNMKAARVTLKPFSVFERLDFLNSFKEFNDLPFEEKWEISEICGGVPFELNLFAHNTGTKVERSVILKKLRSQNIPDFFLGEMAKNRLQLLTSRALFRDNSLASPMFEAFWQTYCQEKRKDASGFSGDIKILSDMRMLVATKEPGDEILRFFVHPVLRDRFLRASDSKFKLSESEIRDWHNLISEFYYALFYAQLKTDPKSAFSYLGDCLEYAVLGGNCEDVAEFLEIFLDGYRDHVFGGKIWTLFENISEMLLKERDNADYIKWVEKMGKELVQAHPILSEKLLTFWRDHPLADSEERVLSLEIFGRLGLYLNKYEKSLENYSQYVSSLAKFPEIEKTFGLVYYEMGKSNLGIEQWKEAVDCFLKSIDWSVKLNERKRLGEVHRLLGCSYRENKDYESALGSFKKAMECDGTLEDESGITESHFYLGDTHLLMKNWSEAIKNFATALDRGKSSNNVSQIEISYNGLANACAGQDQWGQMKGLLLMAAEAIASAKAYLNRSITLEKIREHRARYDDSDWQGLQEALPRKIVESLKDGSYKNKN